MFSIQVAINCCQNLKTELFGDAGLGCSIGLSSNWVSEGTESLFLVLRVVYDQVVTLY